MFQLIFGDESLAWLSSKLKPLTFRLQTQQFARDLDQSGRPQASDFVDFSL